MNQAKRPAVISAVAIAEAVIAIVVLLAARNFPVPHEFPDWVKQWVVIAAVGHLGSALFLWRLNWLGPLSFTALWGTGIVLGQFFVPRELSPGAVGTTFALAVLAIYLYIVWKDRALFSTRHDQPKPTDSTH